MSGKATAFGEDYSGTDATTGSAKPKRNNAAYVIKSTPAPITRTPPITKPIGADLLTSVPCYSRLAIVDWVSKGLMTSGPAAGAGAAPTQSALQTAELTRQKLYQNTLKTMAFLITTATKGQSINIDATTDLNQDFSWLIHLYRTHYIAIESSLAEEKNHLVLSLPELEKNYFRLRRPFTPEEIETLTNLLNPATVTAAPALANPALANPAVVALLQEVHNFIIEYNSRPRLFESKTLKDARSLREQVMEKIASMLLSLEALPNKDALQPLSLILEYLQSEYDQIDQQYPAAGKSSTVSEFVQQQLLKVGELQYKLCEYTQFTAPPLSFDFTLVQEPKPCFQLYNREWLLQNAMKLLSLGRARRENLLFWVNALRTHARYQVLIDMAIVTPGGLEMIETISAHHREAMAKILEGNTEPVSSLNISVPALLSAYFKNLKEISATHSSDYVANVYVIGQNFYTLLRPFDSAEASQWGAIQEKMRGLLQSGEPVSFDGLACVFEPEPTGPSIDVEDRNFYQKWTEETSKVFAAWSLFLRNFQTMVSSPPKTTSISAWNSLCHLAFNLEKMTVAIAQEKTDESDVRIIYRENLCQLFDFCLARLIEIQRVYPQETLIEKILALSKEHGRTEFLTPITFLHICWVRLKSMDLSPPRDAQAKSKINHNKAIRQAIEALETLRQSWINHTEHGSLFDKIILILQELEIAHSMSVGPNAQIYDEDLKKIIRDLFHETRGVTAYLPDCFREQVRGQLLRCLEETTQPSTSTAPTPAPVSTSSLPIYAAAAAAASKTPTRTSPSPGDASD